MSFINFEKSSGKHYYTHQEVDQKLEENNAKKAEEEKFNRQKTYKDSLSLDKQWMLPALKSRLSGKESSKHKQKRSRKSSQTSTSSSSRSASESDENITFNTVTKEKQTSKKNISHDGDLKRDDWMGIASFVPTFDKNQKSKNRVVNQCIVATPGQSERELNPYWKDGGTGLPRTNTESLGTSSTVGDRGLEWYEKALKRSEETAKETGRTLADVVAERWGSLEHLMALISKAKSSTNRETREKHRQTNFRRPGEEYGRSSSSKRSEDIKYHGRWRKERGIRSQSKDSRSRRRSRSRSRSSSMDRSDVKSKHKKLRKHLKHDEIPNSDKIGSECKRRVENDFENSVKGNEDLSDSKTRVLLQNDQSHAIAAGILTDEELNALAAKLVKAEIMGKTDQIEKLKKKLADARIAREKNTESSSSMPVRDETIILMKTTRSGAIEPVEKPLHIEPKGGRRKERKVSTHNERGQRVRYFPDDDQRNLKDMFEMEKCGTSNDDKELFMKMAAKRANVGSDEEDAAFADAARLCESEGKRQQKALAQSTREARSLHRTLENCAWCLDSPRRAKHLIVAIGQTCYLCLPAEEPLTPLHCLIVPIQHVVSGVVLDEDVWEEVHKFRRAIVNMANTVGDDVVFFEQVRTLNKRPHMVMHCAVIAKEAGDSAPIYFKKAMLECESEWSNNKKVVDIKGSDVRGTVPKGLPYFAVEFPPQGGFAHIIEDEKLFPTNFAHAVIGGMLDLDHSKWRKPKICAFSVQRERTVAFARKFAKHDFTSKTERKNKTRSSSSSSSSSSGSSL